MPAQKTAGATLRGDDPEARREAARLLGSARTERKRITSAQNIEKAQRTGRPILPLAAFACTCGHSDSLEGHPTTCPRGRAIRRRRKAGKPLQ